MINSQIKSYDYYVLTTNDYGQDVVPTEPAGQVRMAINITNQTNQDNILYSKAEYIGLTHDKVFDTYIIQYNKTKLKVLYINEMGRYTQVFMTRMA